MASVFDELDSRGLVVQVSDPKVRAKLAGERLTAYVGFDPTADSLHLGHLVPLLAASHLQRAGHSVIVLMGGATGMVGDPSGRSEERALLSPDEVRRNVEGQRAQMRRFVRFEGENAALLVNNADWIAPMSFIDWLRDVGKHFTVNYMLAKDSVKSRMGGERGISFTEFSYMTMQAYDFLHLYRERGCVLQCGGNDQWGNIVAGIDLIRKVEGAEAYGLTFPLVTTASGEKFGKSAGNAVWLDADRTPVFDFYQYWMRVDDRDAGRYLRYFTFLEPGEIEAIEAGMRERPEERPVQRRLAHEATALVHGEEAAERAERETEIMYGRSRSVSGSRSRSRTGSTADSASGPRVCSTSELSDATLAVVPMAELDEGLSLPRLMREVGLADSSSAASAVIKGGGAYVNGERVTDPKRIITRDDLGPGGLLELRAGRKRRMVVKFE